MPTGLAMGSGNRQRGSPSSGGSWAGRRVPERPTDDAMSSVIPVYPTSASLMRHGMGDEGWREWFPFSAGTGSWTFSGRVALYHGLSSLNIPPGSTILVPTYHQGVEIE